MSTRRPNILLITTDQQRGDYLGIEGHPFLQTPNLDFMARHGSYFRRAYSESPSCIAARRTLLSGIAPAVNGMVGYRDGQQWNPPHTIAGMLADAGYQTELIGKLHLYPYRKRYGFDHMSWSDATHPWGMVGNDYLDWLRDSGAVPLEGGGLSAGIAHGVSVNSWVGRPNFLPEHLTHTFWCANQVIDFMHRRDPSSPFFLYLSFIDPHPPMTPPQMYYDRYVNLPLPAPVVGDWAPHFDGPQKGITPNNATVLCLDKLQMQYCRAAYCGMINHVDNQIARVMDAIANYGQLADTFILFTSDHGEMLGDHNLFCKGVAYEASARVPMMARAPAWMNPAKGVETFLPVGLQDIAPTLLDVAGVPIPTTMTGRSLLPIIRGESPGWREYLHGEHSPLMSIEGMQYLTDGRMKYIWLTNSGREQLFDLSADPNELRDLARRPDAESMLTPWRERMIQVLRDRPEGFTDGHQLIPGRPYVAMVPGKG